MASKLFTGLAPNYPCSKIAFWELTHHWRTKCLLFFHFSLTGLLFWDSIASFIGCGVNWVKICPPNQFQARADHGQFWCVVWIIFTVYVVEGTLAWGLWGLLQVVLQWWFINTTLNVKQPRSLTTILVKTFGTLSHLHMIYAFLYQSASPSWRVLGVSGQKRLKNLSKCMDFSFVRGWRGKPKQSRIYNWNCRSLANSLPKRGGKRKVLQIWFNYVCQFLTGSPQQRLVPISAPHHTVD